MQNFETANIPNVPNCSIVENFGNGNSWKTNTISMYGFNSKVLQYEYTCSSAANTWYYTQGLNLTAGIPYTISYKYGSNSDAFVEKMKVAYGTSPVVTNMTNVIADHDNINFNMAVTNEATFTPEASGNYYFGFNAYSDSCQFYLYVDDIIIQNSLSIKDISHEEVLIYPNPAQNILNISHNNIISNVSIYNIVGQKVIDKNFNVSKVQMDLSALPIGTYLVKSVVDNQVITSKVIKE